MNKLVNRFRTWLFADIDLRLTALEGKSADQQKGLIEACGAIDQNARISEENFRGISVTFTGVGKRLDALENANKPADFTAFTGPTTNKKRAKAHK